MTDAGSIDLNADLGESYGRWVLGDDEGLMPLLTSANIACGFHAGDPLTLLRTCRLAARHDVAVGAQVGYHDLAGFGRRFVDVAPDELSAEVLYQVGALAGMCRASGTRLRYVKPHGALYHAVVTHEGQAAAVVEAVRAFDPSLAVLGLPGSALLAAADGAGLRAVGEAFADRGYAADGTLVPRGQPGALLEDPETVAERAVRFTHTGTVHSVDGREVAVAAESLCLHGDTPGAVAMATAVRVALEEAGVVLRPFAA